MKDFLDLDDLPDDRLEAVLESASRLERDPVGDALRGRTAGLLFLNPSVRTLASMQAAVSQQGGQSFVVVQRGGSHQRYAVEVVASSGAEALVRGISPGELVAADAALAEAPPEAAPGAKPAGDAKPAANGGPAARPPAGEKPAAEAKPEAKPDRKAEPRP